MAKWPSPSGSPATRGARFIVALLASAGLAAAAACRQAPAPPQPAAATVSVPPGAIKGRVHLTGTPPPNAAIWMQGDPMCRQAKTDPPVVQEAFLTSPDGGLANVFVRLRGEFPPTPVPTEPVRIDQRRCLYSPRVVGVRIGQPLRVSNSDPGLHNVHGISPGTDGFNVAQPLIGMTNQFNLRSEGVLRVMCDVHPWMIAFVGVVDHPYFAVSSTDGTFEIADVPAGTHTIEAWHERLGTVTSSVRVEAGGVAAVELRYSTSGVEK